MIWYFREHDNSANAERNRLGKFLLPLILIKISRVIDLKEVVGLGEMRRKLKVLQQRNLLLISFGVFLRNQLKE
jgi:hypothetical protein